MFMLMVNQDTTKDSQLVSKMLLKFQSVTNSSDSFMIQKVVSNLCQSRRKKLNINSLRYKTLQLVKRVFTMVIAMMVVTSDSLIHQSRETILLNSIFKRVPLLKQSSLVKIWLLKSSVVSQLVELVRSHKSIHSMVATTWFT